TYAAWKLAANGVGSLSNFGDATRWAATASSAGYRVDQSPSVGSIAQWNQGHVAYVEAVTATFIEISDDNYGTNKTDRFRILVGSGSWPDNFIHVKDVTSAWTPMASQAS